uniref:TACC_C domain-containing protein n=1 Tax=Angiostrongylus cantonensis TaxID=6313 RepID=A0A0K0D7I2_ANGCA
MEHALEDALTEALGRYKEQNEYWRSKHADLKQSLERAKAEIAQHVKDKENMKIKAKLERADLENRLTSSIEHVAMLVSQVHHFSLSIQ